MRHVGNERPDALAPPGSSGTVSAFSWTGYALRRFWLSHSTFSTAGMLPPYASTRFHLRLRNPSGAVYQVSVLPAGSPRRAMSSPTK